jgi:hypothetical protein
MNFAENYLALKKYNAMQNINTFRVKDTPDGNVIVTLFWIGTTPEELGGLFAQRIFGEVHTNRKIFDGFIHNNKWQPQVIENLRKMIDGPVNAVKIEKE